VNKADHYGTAKVISRFHWNLVLWLGLPVRRSY